MTIGEVISIMRGAVTEIISIIAPVLGLALIVGLVVAILQAVTSILGSLPERAISIQRNNNLYLVFI